MQDLPDDDSRFSKSLAAVGRNLRAERMQQNLTQEELFLAAGVDRVTLQSIEAGRANPTLITLLKLAHVLNVPLASLVKDHVSP